MLWCYCGNETLPSGCVWALQSEGGKPSRMERCEGDANARGSSRGCQRAFGQGRSLGYVGRWTWNIPKCRVAAIAAKTFKINFVSSDPGKTTVFLWKRIVGKSFSSPVNLIFCWSGGGLNSEDLSKMTDLKSFSTLLNLEFGSSWPVLNVMKCG